MSIAAWVSAYTGSTTDRLRQLLIANTVGATSEMATGDLWLMFLAERGYTTGSLNDRIRNYLLSYTGTGSGSTDDLWASITTQFSESPSFTGLLDTYTGAVAGYSMGRRLKGSHSGALFRVRRSSDDTQQDIGFDSEGIVDVAALTSFVGANDGFLVTLYDQSGSGLNLTQATPGKQPPVILAGVLQTFGTAGRPAAVFSTGAATRLSSAQFNPNAAEFSAFAVCRTTGNATQAFLAAYGVATNEVGEWQFLAPISNGSVSAGIAYNSSGTINDSMSAVPNSNVIAIRGSAGAPVRGCRVGTGSETTSSTVTAGNWGTASGFLNLGARSDDIGPYNGLIGEFFVWTTMSPALNTTLASELQTFWGVP